MQAHPITGDILRELWRLLGVHGNVPFTVTVRENCFVLTCILPGRQQLRIVIQFTQVISIDLTQLHNLQNFMIELFFRVDNHNVKTIECDMHNTPHAFFEFDERTNQYVYCTTCHGETIDNIDASVSDYFRDAIDLQDIIDEIEEMYIDGSFYITVSIEPIPES